MIDLEKKQLFIIGAVVIVVLAAMYFWNDYLTTKVMPKIVRKEIKNIVKQKKKTKHGFVMKEQQSLPHHQYQRAGRPVEREFDMEMKQQDMDSYIDPEDGGEAAEVEQQPPSKRSSRMSKDNIMMRDMMDGSLQ
jgi:uncharacterized protein YxeA